MQINFRVVRPIQLKQTILPQFVMSVMCVCVCTGSHLVQLWKFFSDSMAALVAMLHEYSSFMQVRNKCEGESVRSECVGVRSECVGVKVSVWVCACEEWGKRSD